MKRRFALLLAALFTALALTACGGSGGGSITSSSGSGMAPGNTAPSDMAAESGGEFWALKDAASPEEPQEEPREAEDRLANAKMVYTATIEAETTEFETCASGLEAAVARMGGYLEYASTSSYGSGYHSGSYTARIPSAQFNAFLNTVGEIGHVTNLERNSDNISERYYDTESRLTTQKTKLERLQTLLAKAENMEDIITIETAIAETELEIEQLTGSLRHYDALVDFATVHVYLHEVSRLSTVEEAPPTFASQLGTAFTDGLRSFGDFLQSAAIFLAYNWTWLAVLAVILFLSVHLARKRRARRAEFFQRQEVQRPAFFRRREKEESKKPDDKQPKD